MDNAVVAAAVLSASLQVLFDRLASRQVINFFWRRKHDEVKQPVDDAAGFNHTIAAPGDYHVIEVGGASSEATSSSSSTAQTVGQQITICTVGPFGGQGGNKWDDGIHTTIRQIKLHHGSRINSIKIEYDQNGESKWSDLHGKGDGVETTIKLNFPTEFLWSISGHSITTGDSNTTVVSSLKIRSNRKVYGPYGKEEGQPFSASSTSGKIIGLFGTSDTYVNSIGYYTDQPHPSISIGPFGGCAGHEWNDGTYTTIRQIVISHGDAIINSIKIEYDLNGQSTWSDKHGESVGRKQAVVKLAYPREFLVDISGYFSEHNTGGPVVRSLTIQSNMQKYGPFGTEHGKHFSTTTTGGKITGFHGRCGLSLDSIAAYFDANDHEFLSIGPFGGHGGNQWDDGTYTGIREIYIRHGVVIDSIQINYDKDGESISSDLRGGTGGHLLEEVKLDYPNEYLISISGYVYTKEASITVIQSLIIQSNKKQYGPYGGEEGKYFSTSSTGGKIVGFYGRCGRYLDSIGAYYEPF